jgi:hypothetical protein
MTAKKHPPNNPTDKSKSKYGIFLLVRVWTQYTKLRVVIRSNQFLDKIIEKYICNKKKKKKNTRKSTILLSVVKLGSNQMKEHTQ